MWHELLDHIGAGLMHFWEMRSGHTKRPERPGNDIALMMVMTALVAAPWLLFHLLIHFTPLSLPLTLSCSLSVFGTQLAPKIGQCNVN